MSYLDINGLRVFWTKIKSWVTNQGYGTYSKPQQGIPKTDLANSVQTSLSKADSALQTAPVTSVNSKTGAVSLTASDVGLGNVGNFKAVSTQSNQGLTVTEKENARTNIGAGTSSFSGNYADLSNTPTIPTKVSQLTNDSGYTTNTGTITGITMNGDVKGTSGVVNLGVVLTEHQDISNYAKTSDLTTHTGNTTVHITSTERTNWNAAKTHADSAHAPSNAEVNQNAFSNVKVGSTTVAADSKTDTLELVAGTNITLIPDATNDKVTITAKDTTYGVATSSALGLIKSGTDITVDSSGNVSVNDDSHNHIISNIDGLQNVLDGKLSKTTYEYNKELALGSSGKVCIGVFPCYDSNISVEIKSTTNITYNGTLIIATQNINTSLGGTYTATVYGDENNTLTSAIKIQYLSGSNAFSVYINLPPWSKNLLHIQCVSLAGTPSSIATIVDTIPSTATIIPTNAFSHTHNYAGSSSVGGAANKVANTLTIQGNGTTLTNGTYDGSAAKTVNITPANIGAAASSHTHTVANISDLTATATELNYCDGVTSNIQTQLNNTVKLSGNQTISGIKTFNGEIKIDDIDASIQPRLYTNMHNSLYIGVGEATFYMNPHGTLYSSVDGTFIGTNTISDYAVTGVKGSAESSYRSGDVNITPANIGAAASSHTHSASNITSGTLGITRGGTGATTASAARTNLGLTGVEKKTLLWTNASPTNRFDNQTLDSSDGIPDLSNYDALEIEFKTYATSNSFLISRHPIGVESVLTTATGGSATLCPVMRIFTANASGITFSDYFDWNFGKNNTVCVPTKIYGIREV